MSNYPETGITAYLREAIKSPRGVHAPEVQGWPTHRVNSTLWLLCSRGEAFKADLGHKRVHYFASQEDAAAFQAAHQARHVPPRILRAPIEVAEDRAARTGSARGKAHERQQDRQRLRINATAAPLDANRPPPRITYGPTPTTGPLSGLCPADRPLVMRAGALDYQRHMAKHQPKHQPRTPEACE